MDHKTILEELKKHANPKNVEGMARFGIRPKSKVLGISVTELRKFARDLFKDETLRTNSEKRHELAGGLWKSNIHEAKILSTIIDIPGKLTKKQMDQMIKDFDSWDICDLACGNLFDKTPYAFDKAIAWSKRKEEFEKRAGYALMATTAWHRHETPDSEFIKFFPHIKRGATDERNFVKKAVNWALRQVGKRNKNLNKEAIKLALEIHKLNSKSAKWIAKDALRELKSEGVQKRLTIKS